MASSSSKKLVNTSSTGDSSLSSAERLAEVRETMKSQPNQTTLYDDSDIIFCVFVLAAVKEISDLLNTGLDDETLRICVQLLEAGVNPEALANVVQELKREAAAIRVCW